MISKNKLIWVVGNHEFLILKRLEEQIFKNHNDTYETLLKLALYNSNKSSLSDDEVFEELNKMGLRTFMLDNLVPFYEMQNYVFAHGFIPLKRISILKIGEILNFHLGIQQLLKMV